MKTLFTIFFISSIVIYYPKVYFYWYEIPNDPPQPRAKRYIPSRIKEVPKNKNNNREKQKAVTLEEKLQKELNTDKTGEDLVSLICHRYDEGVKLGPLAKKKLEQEAKDIDLEVKEFVKQYIDRELQKAAAEMIEPFQQKNRNPKQPHAPAHMKGKAKAPR